MFHIIWEVVCSAFEFHPNHIQVFLLIMTKCKIKGCSSESGKQENITFSGICNIWVIRTYYLFPTRVKCISWAESFHFPKSVPHCQDIRSQWIRAIERHQQFEYHIQTFTVCSLHFRSDDLKAHGKRRVVKRGRIPSIFPSEDGIPLEDPCNTSYELDEGENVWEFGNIEMDENSATDTNSE